MYGDFVHRLTFPIFIRVYRLYIQTLFYSFALLSLYFASDLYTLLDRNQLLRQYFRLSAVTRDLLSWGSLILLTRELFWLIFGHVSVWNVLSFYGYNMTEEYRNSKVTGCIVGLLT